MRIPPSAFHALPHSAPPNPPPRLFPREGDKIQSLQGCQGEGNSCSRDWSVTMAVGTRVTDNLDFHSTWKTPTLGRVTFSSDSNGQAES